MQQRRRPAGGAKGGAHPLSTQPPARHPGGIRNPRRPRGNRPPDPAFVRGKENFRRKLDFFSDSPVLGRIIIDLIPKLLTKFRYPCMLRTKYVYFLLLLCSLCTDCK